MATYSGLVLRTAFRRWDNRTDLASGVLGALVPCAFVVAGKPVPDNVSILVAEIAVGIVVSTVIVRLLAAPYLIWLADQEKIGELQRKLDDPERRRREAFEDSMQKARGDFAIEMRKYLHGHSADCIRLSFNEQVLQHLSNYACYFESDHEFCRIWRNFVNFYRDEYELTTIPVDIPDHDGFWEAQINRNLNYYFQLRRATATAIIKYLTYVEDYEEYLDKEYYSISTRSNEVGRVDILRTSRLAEALASRSPQGTEAETQP